MLLSHAILSHIYPAVLPASFFMTLTNQTVLIYADNHVTSAAEWYVAYISPEHQYAILLPCPILLPFPLPVNQNKCELENAVMPTIDPVSIFPYIIF